MANDATSLNSFVFFVLGPSVETSSAASTVAMCSTAPRGIHGGVGYGIGAALHQGIDGGSLYVALVKKS